MGDLQQAEKPVDVCWIAPKRADNACSGFIVGKLHCKHGHVQTNGCVPFWSDQKQRWYPNFAPSCCNEELAAKLAPRFGGHLHV